MYVTVDRTTNPPVPLTVTVTDPSGNVYASDLGLPDPSGFPFPMIATPTSVTDLNGNQITNSTVNGVNTWTDSTGSPALTLASTVVNGSPTVTYSYPNPSGGAPENVVVNYSSLTMKTTFNCPGRTDITNGYYQYFPTSINLPDGSSYTIVYESTDGSYPPSTVTGRVHSLTLPTGATITYTYSGGTNGIVCSDGGPATLTKQTPDGTWTYARTLNSNGTWSVKVKDPLNNDTLYTFDSTSSIELQRLAYQGPSTSGNLLQQDLICYNNNFTNCATTATLAPSILQKDLYTYIAGVSNPSLSETTYLYEGILSGDKEYGFAPNTGRTNFISSRVIQYGSYASGTCNAVVGINVRPCTDTTYANNGSGGNGAVLAQSLTTYDSHGNVTAVQQYTGSTYLTKNFTPNANGLNTMVTDVNGAQTSYTYGACNGSYPTLVSEPLSLSKNLTWDCNGGVPTSVTDENGQATVYGYIGDPFWRVTSVTDPLHNVTNNTYTATSTESSLIFNSNASTTDVLTTLDSMGRVHLKQQRQAPGSANFDTVVYTYDADGRQSSITLPCVSTAGVSCSAAATTTTYDALARPLQVTDGGGGTTTFVYTANDVLQTIGPAPTGEHVKSKQMEYDGVGRLSSACEVTSGTGGGACGQNSPQTGFRTSYTYDPLGNLTGVTQNAQGSPQETRSYAYDGLGRMTSETNPETGTTRYIYDVSSGTTCASWGYTTPYPGDLVEKDNANGDATCSLFDSLHRVLATYNFGPNTTPSKHFVYDNDSVNGVTMSNAKGRIAGAFTCTAGATTCTGNVITDEYFNYSARGELTETYESTPHSGGYFHPTAAYWATGALQNLWMSGLPSVGYGAEGEGRTSTVSATSGQNPVTGVTYNESGSSQPIGVLTQVTFGSSDSDNFQYDPNTGRMTKYTYSVNGRSEVGALNWNANSTLSTLGITDPFNAGNAQNCTYVHDDLARLQNVACGSVWAQSFNYDAFGNTTKSGSSSWMPIYNTKNQYQSIPGFTNPGPTYDANGDLLTDSFHTYTWDAEGHVTAIDSIGLTYDALGRQVEQNQNGTYFQIVYSPMGSKLAVMKGQTIQQAFVPLPGGTTAEYLSWGLSHYRHPDWLGSERLESSTSHSILQDTAYAPFGEPYAELSGGNGEISFTGQNKDTDWLNYDFMYREYDPRQSRWISPDPAGSDAADPSDPQSWNLYAYVKNNPLTLVDPFGLQDDGSEVPGFPPPDDPPDRPEGNPGQAFFFGDNVQNLFWLKPKKKTTCYTLAAGQAPSSNFSTWWKGYVNASSMLDNFLMGTGPTNTDFGPDSPESQQMMSAYGMAQNVGNFLAGGAPSGHQNFGVKGLVSSGLNPTAQFVGSYDWSMSRSGGNLNITLTNPTDAWSALLHAPGLNPNPPTRFDSVFNPGWHPMGRVNQTFHIQVPCP